MRRPPTWRSDLTRIRVFSARSATSVQPLSALHFQTELGINAHPTGSAVCREVENTCSVVFNVHRAFQMPTTSPPKAGHDVINIHGTAPDIHRNTLRSCEDIDGQNPAASPSCTVYHRVTGYRCSDSRQVNTLDCERIRRLVFAFGTPGESPPTRREIRTETFSIFAATLQKLTQPLLRFIVGIKHHGS